MSYQEKLDDHDVTIERHRMTLQKVIDLMWSDVVAYLPHLEDDPDVIAVRGQAEDANRRLFNILQGMNNIFRAEQIRYSRR